MKRVWAIIVPLFLVSCQSVPLQPQPRSIAVWIDTDPSVGEKDRDVDDGLALLQAFHSPELEIRGVSTIFGNTDQEHAYAIGKKLVDEFGTPGVQVHQGAKRPSDLGQETPASLALADALRKERLTILAIGPVTNIATVLKNHPELKERISEVIAVAGRRPGQRFTTGKKNPKAHRDFNFEQDSRAFQILLDSRVPLVLTPFEISSTVWINSTDLARLDSGDAAKHWLAKAASDWLMLWKRTFDVEGFNPFDTLAIGYITDRQLYSCESVELSIRSLPDDSTEERMQGTKVSSKPYLFASKEEMVFTHPGSYCFHAQEKFKESLMERLLK